MLYYIILYYIVDYDIAASVQPPCTTAATTAQITSLATVARLPALSFDSQRHR